MESINLPFAPHTYIYLFIDLNPPCEKPTLLTIIYGLIIILGGGKNGGEEEINVGVVTEIHSHFEQFFKPICHATSL